MTVSQDRSLRDIPPRELPEILQEIPPLPEVYQDLFQRMQDPDQPVAQIAEAIVGDQAVAGKILHLVNSAFCSCGHQVETIGGAVVILGFRAVRNAALAISVFDHFGDEASSERMDMTQFWTHSIGVASVAKVLGERAGISEPEEAFVVGLLHDIGKLVEKRCFPADFEAVADLAAGRCLTWLEAERALLPVHHATIARALFRAWHFPPSIVSAIGHHHEPQVATRSVQMAALLHVANAAAYELDLRAPGSITPGALSPEAVKLLGVALPVSEEVEALIHAEVERSLKILDLL